MMLRRRIATLACNPGDSLRRPGRGGGWHHSSAVGRSGQQSYQVEMRQHRNAAHVTFPVTMQAPRFQVLV